MCSSCPGRRTIIAPKGTGGGRGTAGAARPHPKRSNIQLGQQPYLHFYYSQDLSLHLCHSRAKWKPSNILQVMGPTPQLFRTEIQVPCQPLYKQIGGTQSCCSHDKKTSINYLQVQKESPVSPELCYYPTALSEGSPPASTMQYPITKAPHWR